MEKEEGYNHFVKSEASETLLTVYILDQQQILHRLRVCVKIFAEV